MMVLQCDIKQATRSGTVTTQVEVCLYRKQYITLFIFENQIINRLIYVRSSTVVKVLCYKPEDCWFDPS